MTGKKKRERRQRTGKNSVRQEKIGKKGGEERGTEKGTRGAGKEAQ